MRLARELRRILPCAVLLWTALLCSLVGRHLMGRLGGGDLGLVGLVRTGRLWCCHGPFQCDRAAFLAGVTGVGSLRPGDCECEEGYVGEACEPRCVSNCTGHGRCDAPDTCVCAGQWSGEHCEQAACLQPCLHGTCTAPDVCACKSHYHGPACDVYCDRHGEYIGGNLTGGLRGLPRAERASTRESQCRCHAGWAGAGCGQPVCHAVKCVRGTCVAPNECRCMRPWVGPQCNAQATKEGTLRFLTDDVQRERERKWSEEVAELKSQRSRLHRLVDGEARAAKQAVPPPWKPSWVAGGKVQRRGGAETHRSSAALDQLHRSVADEFREASGVGGGGGDAEERW